MWRGKAIPVVQGEVEGAKSIDVLGAALKSEDGPTVEVTYGTGCTAQVKIDNRAIPEHEAVRSGRRDTHKRPPTRKRRVGERKCCIGSRSLGRQIGVCDI